MLDLNKRLYDIDAFYLINALQVLKLIYKWGKDGASFRKSLPILLALFVTMIATVVPTSMCLSILRYELEKCGVGLLFVVVFSTAVFTVLPFKMSVTIEPRMNTSR